MKWISIVLVLFVLSLLLPSVSFADTSVVTDSNSSVLHDTGDSVIWYYQTGPGTEDLSVLSDTGNTIVADVGNTVIWGTVSGEEQPYSRSPMQMKPIPTI